MPKSTANYEHIQWFRGAAPYINAHRGRTFVIEFGGEAVADANFASLINDIALLNSLGVRLVIVHGARPQIETHLKNNNVESAYARGLRITDEASLPLVKQAVGSVRVEIEAQLSRSLANTPLSGSPIRVMSGNFVIAKPYGVHDGIDFCLTGEIRKVDHAAIRELLNTGNIVLLSPLGYSPTGEVFNLRAEDIATATAAALDADKLIFMMEGPGLVDGKRQPVRELAVNEVADFLKRRKALPEPVIHDLQSAVSACSQGVKRVHLLSRELDGSLLQELYTRDGAGTLVTADKFERLRAARIEDVGGILELIAPLEANGTLVKRSREQLELEIDYFMVLERDGMIVGCAALYPYPAERVGELACIVIHPDYTKDGRGNELLHVLEQRARQLGLTRLFALTTRTLHWFRERGFTPGDLQALPVRKRELYNYHRNSKVLFKAL